MELHRGAPAGLSLLWYRQGKQALGGTCVHVCAGARVPTELRSQEGGESQGQLSGPALALLFALSQAVTPPGKGSGECHPHR